MTPDDLKARTKQFAVDVLRFARTIPRDPTNNDMARQLARAASSAAACYRAVCRARSRTDFVYKLGNTIEEVDEAALWLELLTEGGICAASATEELWKEADQLTRIFVRSRDTARRKRLDKSDS